MQEKFILHFNFLKLCMVVGLSIQGLKCGISCLWVLKVFQLLLVLVWNSKVGYYIGCFNDEFVLV